MRTCNLKSKKVYDILKKGINVLVAISFLAMTSCRTSYLISAEPKYNDDWRGASYNEIVAQLGAPDRETSDGKGGNILVYEEKTQISKDAVFNSGWGSRGTTGSVTNTNVKYVQYFVNSDDECYLVRTNLTLVKSKVSSGKTVMLIILCACVVGGAVALAVAGASD